MLENIGPNDAELPGAVGRLQNPGGGGGHLGAVLCPICGGLPQKCGAEGPQKCESAP